MEHQGKPPKSRESIRSALQSISDTAEAVQHAGPNHERTQAERKIVVASFFNHQLGREFQKELSRRELFSSSVVRDRKLVISVDYDDAQLASSLSEQFRSQHPDRRNPLDSSRYDCLFFGVAVGLAIAMLFIVGAKNQTAGIAFGLAVVGFFAAIGNFLDRAMNIRTGFSLWDLFLVVAIIGMAVGAAQGLPLLLK